MTMMTVMTMLPTAGKISPLCIVEGRVMKKRFGILLLLSVLVVSLLTVVNVSANEIICSGYCGGDNTAEYDDTSKAYKNLSWTLYANGLRIQGTGIMTDESTPWAEVQDKIESLVIDLGVTSIKSNAFYNCDNLATVSVPNGVTEISTYAFYSCDSLSSVSLPSSITSIDNKTYIQTSYR